MCLKMARIPSAVRAYRQASEGLVHGLTRGLRLLPLLRGVVALGVTALVWLWCPLAAAQVRAEAYLGRPFGVAKIDLPVPGGALPDPLGIDGLAIYEAEHRVLYPVISGPPLGGFFADMVNAAPSGKIYFLFQGNAPLEVTVATATPFKVEIVPRRDSRRYERLLRQWWQRYGGTETDADYPPFVEHYLKSMLAHRFSLRVPKGLNDQSWEEWFRTKLGLALSSEPLRLAMMHDRFFQSGVYRQTADQPLPAPWDETPAGKVPDVEVEVEPIAEHVPAECFYIRFGSFQNFLWLQDTMKQWGGDFQSLVALRSLNYGISEKIERQLVVKQTALARMLGGTVVADVAMIGRDLYFQEGPSFGLLFHARNNALFLPDILSRRAQRVRDGQAVEEKVTVAGHEVSYLHSPDGRIRSYLASDGNFHLVTTSRSMVERFYEAGAGKGSLGASAEFRYARSLFPLERDDTAFVYLSREFLQGLTGPQYRIETERRLQALADMDMVQLALLASAAEGNNVADIPGLVEAGYLPEDFAPRPDGSRAVLTDEGDVVDSLRGARGAFTPIADVPVSGATPHERNVYARFLEHYRTKWQRLDPITVAVQRDESDEAFTRMVIDARITPFAKENHQKMMESLGPADAYRLAPVAGNIGQFEVILKRGRLFGGLQDMVPPIDIVGGRVIPTGRFRDILVGYIGTTGELGWLGRFNEMFSRRPDPNGYTVGLFGLWRREMDGATVFSFQPDVLAAATSQLQFEEAPEEAHFRLDVGNIAGARLTPLLNDFVYWRTRQTSLGNLKLLQSLEQQMHVPGEACKDTAEMLLDVELSCPLGGEYEYQVDRSGIGRWHSTAMVPGGDGRFLSTKAPEGFLTPPLDWFRGLSVHGLVTPEAVSAHAEVLMAMPEEAENDAVVEQQ